MIKRDLMPALQVSLRQFPVVALVGPRQVGKSTLARVVGGAIDRSGRSGAPVGMSFWTDAAILADAGIPSVLFGPGGAGLHSTVEYVNVEDVVACRDVLCDAIRTFVR